MTLVVTSKNAFALKLAAVGIAIGSLFAAGSLAASAEDSAPAQTNAACLHCWI